LHQVLLNLCVNARDAMPEGGVLKLAADNIQLDKAGTALIPGAQPGQYVLLRVTDNGAGIPPEILERIFDPFFTTKDGDKGTGLGLPTVLSIVNGHAGFIQVDSQLRAGTEFRIYLPAATEASPQTPPAATALAKHSQLGQGEQILVVDDEELIRDLFSQTLKKNGYRVLSASNGMEAIATYAQHRDAIQVVVTDLMMPLVDGVVAIRALKRMNPAVKIIVVTGSAGGRKVAELAALGIDKILQKPFPTERLLEVLHLVLKSPAATGEASRGSNVAH
jgi:CheY-like chemotaxis protein